MSRRILKHAFLLMCLFKPSLNSYVSINKSEPKDSCEQSSSINDHENECSVTNANAGKYEHEIVSWIS